MVNVGFLLVLKKQDLFSKSETFSWQMWRQMSAWRIMVVAGRINQLTSPHARYLYLN